MTFRFYLFHLRKRFYEVFYSLFDDQFAVMDAILNRKESFAGQVIVILFDSNIFIFFLIVLFILYFTSIMISSLFIIFIR